MEVAVDYAVQKGSHDDVIIKELAITADGVIQATVSLVRTIGSLPKRASVVKTAYNGMMDTSLTHVANVLTRRLLATLISTPMEPQNAFSRSLQTDNFSILQYFDCPQPRNLNILAVFSVISFPPTTAPVSIRTASTNGSCSISRKKSHLK